ncbi:MAG: hypothetical protein HYY42_06560, partial [Chloroflexi bacterium]|nr:hypothetical protein [Chloroflexota bacterium]
MHISLDPKVVKEIDRRVGPRKRSRFIAAAVERAFGLRPLTAFLMANGAHGALEAQEILTDVFFKTHNVRGWW